MKKWIALLLCFVLSLSLCSCGAILEEDGEESYVEETEQTQEEYTGEESAEETQLSPATRKAYLSDIQNIAADDTIQYNERVIEERSAYNDPSSAQNVTLMFYVCGSDLESEVGAATADINEILYAELGDNVNVIMQTGGCSDWQNSVVANDRNQRYLMTADGMELLEESEAAPMTSPDTLSSFIQFCAENYPADRNILIMWDHGGGTLGGYGVDENFPDEPSMSLAQMDTALRDGGVKFDFIGFDACLMATVETAFVMEQYADYMVASQKTIPGTGWYYTNWVTTLCSDVTIPTQELGAQIVSDFVDDNRKYLSSGIEATLSVMDLTRLPEVIYSINSFLGNARTELTEQKFAEISKARADRGQSRQFNNDYDQIDISDLAKNLSDITGAQELIDAISNCVVANEASVLKGEYNGLNIYFPYTDLTLFSTMVDLYSQIGFNRQYVQFLASFVTVMAGGQQANETSAQQSTEEYTQSEWYDSSLADSYDEYYQQNSVDATELEVFDKDGTWALHLTDEQWSLITTVQIQVNYDDGEGYIDLGSDNVYETDDDGDLLVTFNNTWVTLDGQTVPFYFMAEDYVDESNWYTYGIVPCAVNGKDAQIIVNWSSDCPEGWVSGYQVDNNENVSQKGEFTLQDGDEIAFYCDYYTYDGDYANTYSFGEPLVVSGDITVSYEDIGLGDCLVYYYLTDIYGNQYSTEPVVFKD